MQDYADLSLNYGPLLTKEREAEADLSVDIPSSLHSNLSNQRVRKRENSAFSRFSNSIRSSIGNIFSKNSNKIMIAPI